MKKRILFFILILVFILACPALAIEWKTANQVTVAWDAVTQLAAGETIPAGSVIKYRIHIRDAAGSRALQEVEALQAVVTFDKEGPNFIGVSSVRYVDANKVAESVITWSDVTGTPAPFGFIYYELPASPAALRIP